MYGSLHGKLPKHTASLEVSLSCGTGILVCQPVLLRRNNILPLSKISLHYAPLGTYFSSVKMKLYFLLEGGFLNPVLCVRKIYVHFIEPLPPVYILLSLPAHQKIQTVIISSSCLLPLSQSSLEARRNRCYKFLNLCPWAL